MARSARSIEFFRVWSADMAYILGLWWSDGCMRVKANTGAYEISLASNDREHLVQIGAIIGERYFLRKVASHTKTYVIEFCGKEMYQDIAALGGSPRKSRTIAFPLVPEAYTPHFVRGVIDGDGTLAWNGDRPIVQVYSGSTVFLDGFAAAIAQATGIPAPQRQANRNNWTIKWSTTRAKCLVAWTYEMNAGLVLPRKAALAQNILSWEPRKKPEKGTITERMRDNFAAYLS